MLESILQAVAGLSEGLVYLFTEGWTNVIMLTVAAVLLYLGVAKGVEPLLLVPIGFGCFLVNLPLSEVMGPDGFLRAFYEMGITTELFPLLIFFGIGAMTDFSPLLSNPRILLFGAAGQLGIFLTLMLALAMDFAPLDAATIAVIGACDGPTVIYVASEYAPHLLGAVSVAAYSYMALVPVIQPPIMRAMTTDKERQVRMPAPKRRPSKTLVILFPILVTVLIGIISPKGLPLMGAIMLGNFLKVSGVVPRLVHASENEIANIATLFLGLAIGGTMEASQFLTAQTLLIFGLGFLAIAVDTIGGVGFGKIMYLVTGGKVNPLIGAAGISAYPMAARIVEVEGVRYNHQNHLLMHAMGANTGGQVGSIVAASFLIAIIEALGLA